MEFLIHFVNGAFIEVKNIGLNEYYVQFIDKDTEKLLHDGVISNNMWIKSNYAYFINYQIRVFNNKTRILIKEFNFEALGKKVFITFDSNSFGDNLGWIPFVEEFRIKHKCKIVCATFYNELFEKTYPEIDFVKPGVVVDNLYAMYTIGCFNDSYKNKRPWNTLNNQEIASDFLGLEFKEIRPKLHIYHNNREKQDKYICISPVSTTGCKLWQNETGWQSVIDYLLSINYKIIILGKFEESTRTNPKILYPDTTNVQDLIYWINNCEFHIGLCSGNSWLAWSLLKETIVIGGFSQEKTEFYTPYRIINKNACYGCWNNTNYIFDKGDWDWCPRLKGTDRQFECSKSITSNLIIDKINILLDNNFIKTKAVTIIKFVAQSLGDNIAFSPYADLYQQKYGGKIYVKTIWHNLFYSDNPNVFFVSLEFNQPDIVEKDIFFYFQKGPLQKVVCDQLNLEYKELIPKIKTNTSIKFNRKKKYVCISIQSTSQMKYWTDGGWYKTTEYLKKLGYDVLVIDKYESFGVPDKMNRIPQNATNETGDISLDYRIQQIKSCEFFIGLSSGLSWLAFALDKKVILISGCTNEDNEFKHNCYRVINKNVCHGCLNDETIDNTSNITKSWTYCPRNKKFECSKQINFNMVKEKIDLCLSDIKSGEK